MSEEKSEPSVPAVTSKAIDSAMDAFRSMFSEHYLFPSWQSTAARYQAETIEQNKRAMEAADGALRAKADYLEAVQLAQAEAIQIRVDNRVAELEANRDVARLSAFQAAKALREAQQADEATTAANVGRITTQAQEQHYRAATRAKVREGILMRANLAFKALEQAAEAVQEARTDEEKLKAQKRTQQALRDMSKAADEARQFDVAPAPTEPTKQVSENYAQVLADYIVNKNGSPSVDQRTFTEVYQFLELYELNKESNPPGSLAEWVQYVKRKQSDLDWLTDPIVGSFETVANSMLADIDDLV